ncbi:N/A [soil metagenome]
MAKLLTFFLFVVSGALACALGLTASYDFFTTSNRKTPYGYPPFLLETIAAPRIVVDAGSSSMFGIEPGLIEQAFSLPVIDVADNGSIPLPMKIYRLLKYARRGDTLILPFEWVYYTRDVVPLDFIDKTPDEYAAYYASQPFLVRLAFVVQHLSLHNLSDAGRLYLRKDLWPGHVTRIRADMAKWPLGDRKDDSRRRSSVTGMNCADYIGATGSIPPVVEWAAGELAGLQAQRGVRIYVTWPAVAGANCYDMADGRLPIADQARAIFQRHGIAVVGEPADSYFSPEHMLDTYYHVDSAAARLRTRRLIARLQDAGMKAGEVAGKPTAVLAEEAVRGLP